MKESDVFSIRAAECREQAEASALANVRERCLRAEAAWTAMATRSRRSEDARAAREMVVPAA